ncbi:MAG: helix-turn-helix transcriptional regulator [Hespellia sp.]|nr:helix-turn-helix transcriptional regulator [Hespellia sp.]
MTSFREDLENRLKNPEFAKEYEKLRIEKELVKLIIRTRNEAGMTQKELAERTGIRQSNISRIESGSSSPRIDTLRKIAEGLGKQLVVQFK